MPSRVSNSSPTASRGASRASRASRGVFEVELPHRPDSHAPLDAVAVAGSLLGSSVPPSSPLLSGVGCGSNPAVGPVAADAGIVSLSLSSEASGGESGGGDCLDPYGKAASWKRWPVLLLGVLTILGPYYAFDNPSGTLVALREYMGDADGGFNVRYQLLYSLYSLPNMFLPLVGGVLVDRVGARRVVILCTLLCLAGQSVSIAGISARWWPALWAGRVLFGIGTETLAVAQRILVAAWFIGDGGELALAMGVILAFGRFGSVINDNISALYQGDRVMGAWCVGATFIAASVVAAVALYAVDLEHEAAVLRRLPDKARRVFLRAHGAGQRAPAPATAAAVRVEYPGGGAPDAPDAAGASLDPTSPSPRPEHAHATAPLFGGPRDGAGGAASAPPPPPRAAGLLQRLVPRPVLAIASEVRSFSAGYVVLMPVCVLGFPCITSFNGVASELLQARWAAEGQPADLARVSAVMSILYTVAATLAVFVGLCVDRARRRAVFIALAQALICAAHVLFATTAVPAEALIGLLGVGFAFFAASFWPSIAYLVPVQSLGTAYGLMGAVQNVGLTVAPLLIGELQPPRCGSSFGCVSMLLAGMAAATAALGAAGHVLERRSARASSADGGGFLAFLCCLPRAWLVALFGEAAVRLQGAPAAPSAPSPLSLSSVEASSPTTTTRPKELALNASSDDGVDDDDEDDDDDSDDVGGSGGNPRDFALRPDRAGAGLGGALAMALRHVSSLHFAAPRAGSAGEGLQGDDEEAGDALSARLLCRCSASPCQCNASQHRLLQGAATRAIRGDVGSAVAIGRGREAPDSPR